jgi:hypothetical protein
LNVGVGIPPTYEARNVRKIARVNARGFLPVAGLSPWLRQMTVHPIVFARDVYMTPDLASARRVTAAVVAAGLLALGHSGFAASHAVPRETDIRAAFQKIPISFEQNKGQFPADVQFVARRAPLEAVADSGGIKIHHADSGAGTTLQVRFPHSRLPIAFAAGELLEAKTNYLIGSDPSKFLTDVPHFSSIHAAGVYPGIDLRVHGDARQLEYDFIVAPGAKPSDITLAFEKATNVFVDKKGDLQIRFGNTTIVQRRPVAYQLISGKRRPVLVA